MSEFASWRSYQQFAAAVTREWRFTRSTAQMAFIDAVLSNAGTRHHTLQTGDRLWRAQQGHDWHDEETGGEVPVPHPVERMKPRRDGAKEGRANPQGIPYLYTASHRETAIAEVRPWIGAYVSIAELKVARPLTIVNCTSLGAGSFNYYSEEPYPTTREAANWISIDEAFSRPVTQKDRLADYVPTQILAESFRHHGFDGVAYRSSFGPGHNFALFDLEAAVVACRRLGRVKSLTLVTEDEQPFPKEENIAVQQGGQRKEKHGHE